MEKMTWVVKSEKEDIKRRVENNYMEGSVSVRIK